MTSFLKQIKQLLLTTALLHVAVMAMAQVKPKPTQIKPKPAQATPAAPKAISRQLTDFYHLAADAGIQFYFPTGFRESRALNNEDFSFDYAMEIPGHEFEIWFQVKSQKKNWQTFILSKNDPVKRTENPDSIYRGMGLALAKTLTEDTTYLVRNISQDVLKRYNANSGKSYLLTLPDQHSTKGYKYALVIALEKNQTGTLVAICFTNEKNPEFFKNVTAVSNYIKFK
jgi:hypothetical protein